MSISGFSVTHDPQVQEYNMLRKNILAAEQKRKQEQRRLRMDLGLPDIQDNRGIFSKLLRRNKKERKLELEKVRNLDSDEETIVVEIEGKHEDGVRCKCLFCS